MADRPFDGLLLDWVGTVAHYSSIEWRFATALAEIDRDPADTDALAGAWQAAKEPSGWYGAESTMDLSATNYEAAVRERARVAGFDDELASALWRRYDAADSYTIPPEAGVALAAISAAGVRIAIVSDYHRDLRPDAIAAGLGGLVDHWSISCEVGAQKPDPVIFQHALDGIGTPPERSLMVGDRAETDGRSPDVGIPVLLVPPNGHWLPTVAAVVTGRA